MIMEKQESSPYQKVLMNIMEQRPSWWTKIGWDDD
jgi:hypothetical protein